MLFVFLFFSKTITVRSKNHASCGTRRTRDHQVVLQSIAQRSIAADELKEREKKTLSGVVLHVLLPVPFDVVARRIHDGHGLREHELVATVRMQVHTRQEALLASNIIEAQSKGGTTEHDDLRKHEGSKV